MGEYIAAFAVAWAVCVALTPAVRALAFKTGVVDVPDERRVHKAPTPLLGGVAIFAAFMVTALWLLFRSWSLELAGLVVGGLITIAVGILDDIYDIRPAQKVLGQLAAAVVAYGFGIRIEWVTNPLGGMVYLGLWSFPVTVFWIVAMSNIVNLMDGLDGLAAGVSSIAAATMAVVAVSKGQTQVALLAFALSGAGFGFLKYNFNPAKIFMGDAGALFLGYGIAVISALGALKGAATLALAIPVLSLGVPILDTGFAIVRRFSQHKPFYVADKDHVHHRLLALGLTQRQVVLLIYGITAVLGLSAVWVMDVSALSAGVAYILCMVILAVLAFGAYRFGVLNIGAGARQSHVRRQM